MKTLEELIKEVSGSEQLKSELGALKNSEEAAAWLKKNDCGATVEEFEALFEQQEGAISDEDAANAAGGIYGTYGGTHCGPSKTPECNPIVVPTPGYRPRRAR